MALENTVVSGCLVHAPIRLDSHARNYAPNRQCALNEWHYCSHAQHEEARDSQTTRSRTEMTSAPVSDDSIFLHESVIRGHHIFKEIWTPRTEEIVQVRQEAGNPHDRNAVALLKAEGSATSNLAYEIS